MTAAHDQAVTNRYVIAYPEHPARTGDPHYRDFEHYRRTHVDTARCAKAVEKGTDDECAGGLELHHAHVEFSLQNGVDLAALEAHYPGISNPDEVGAWVESGANLVFLCVLPDVPTLMADGSQRPIKNVHVGDRVITHDGSAQLVTATRRKPYSGKVIRLGATMLTPTHRVLTRRGWSTAAEVSRQVRMHGSHMVALGIEQQQVTGGVVGAVPVDVVDTLGGQQRSADHALHDPSVLHLGVRTAIPIHRDSNVAARRHRSAGSISVLARKAVQPTEAAFVGAVVDGPEIAAFHHYSSRAVAALGVDCGGFVATSSPSDTAAFAAARCVTPSDRRRGEEAQRADDAETLAEWSSGPNGGWYALRDVGHFTYTGDVHDISIANSHSFIAGGMVVHNCEFHHRGHAGVHVASASDYEAETFVRGLIS